jgi:hypothetical protein
MFFYFEVALGAIAKSLIEEKNGLVWQKLTTSPGEGAGDKPQDILSTIIIDV